MSKFKSIFNSTNFGDQSELIFFYHLWAKIKKKKLILHPIKYLDLKNKTVSYNDIGNFELFNCTSKYTYDLKIVKYFFTIYIYFAIFFKLTFFFLKKILLRFKKKNFFEEEVKKYNLGKSVSPNPLDSLYRSSLYDVYKHLFKNYKIIKSDNILLNDFNFKIPKKKFYRCNEELKKIFNINCEDKFIILHVRESSFHNDYELPAGYLRNSKINTYFPAIKFFINNGYKVIRLGDQGMVKINDESLSTENFIDYAHFEKKKKIYELFFIENCKFFFGNGSGVCETARLFGKKIFLSNLFPCHNFPMSNKNDIAILKKTEFKNKILNPEDQLNLHLNILLNEGWEGFKSSNVKIIDNSEEEILELAKKSLVDNFESTAKQIEYISFRRKKVFEFLNNYNVAIDKKGKPIKSYKVMLKFNNLIANGKILNL